MRLKLFILSLLPAIALSDVFSPDPKIFPDWSKTKPLAPENVVEASRLQSFSLSPNSKRVVYGQYQYNKTENKALRNLKLLDLSSPNPSSVDLTEYKYGQGDTSPVWYDNDTVLFSAVRGSPSPNLFSISTTDRKVAQITNYTNGINGIIYSEKAKMIAFTSSVYQGMGIDESAEEAERIESLPSSGMVFKKLFIRHVNVYITDAREQLFTQPIGIVDGKLATTGEAINVIAKYKGEWGLEPDSYEFSPDGKSMLFSAKVQGKEEAWQTDAGIFTVPVDGSAAPTRINSNFNGAASSPAHSPDGKYIAWLQMATPGYESDQNQVILYEIASGKQTRLIPDYIYSPADLVFSNDSKNLYLTVPFEADQPIFKLEIASQKLTRIIGSGYSASFKEKSDDEIVVLHSTSQYPPALFSLTTNGDNTKKQLTFDNDEMLKSVWLSPTETYWFKGSFGEQVQGLVLYPYGYDPSKKYPVFFLIHGGPQSSYYDQWGIGTNYNYYTNQGYIVLMINYHGSSSYGQKFTDSIQHNWGTYPYFDLMEGLDYFIKNAKYADGDNCVAFGGSYGGYMINWINGHTNRFKALVDYVGDFNIAASSYSTDELWFGEHDIGIAWEPKYRIEIEQNNPERFVAKWKTPTLVIHGALDYRVSITEGISAFTALQRQGIESKFLYFPDEGHGASKPPNVLKVQTEVFSWFGKFTNTTLKA